MNQSIKRKEIKTSNISLPKLPFKADTCRNITESKFSCSFLDLKIYFKIVILGFHYWDTLHFRLFLNVGGK